MAKVLSNDGTEFKTVKEANDYDKMLSTLGNTLSAFDPDEQAVIKRALTLKVVRVVIKRGPRKPKA